MTRPHRSGDRTIAQAQSDRAAERRREFAQIAGARGRGSLLPMQGLDHMGSYIHDQMRVPVNYRPLMQACEPPAW